MLVMCGLAYYTCSIVLESGEGGRSELPHGLNGGGGGCLVTSGKSATIPGDLSPRLAVNGRPVEFADVCLHYLGKKAYAVAVVFSVLTLLGASMAYWVRTTCCHHSLSGKSRGGGREKRESKGVCGGGVESVLGHR